MSSIAPKSNWCGRMEPGRLGLEGRWNYSSALPLGSIYLAPTLELRPMAAAAGGTAQDLAGKSVFYEAQ